MRRIVQQIAFVAALLLLAAVTTPVSAQRIIYVDDDAEATGNGTSWATAYRFLQDALADAEAAGEPVEIRVAQGIYKPDRDRRNPEGGRDRDVFFRLNSGMSLLGGYAGIGADDPNRRDSETYQTVLSGDLLGNDAEVTDAAMMKDDPTRADNSSVMHIYGDGSRLDGCVITGGCNRSGALQAGNGSTVSDCTFCANCGDDYFPSSTGAVRAVPKQAPAVFERCKFIRNAGEEGGAVQGSNFVLDHCVFTENYSWGCGGAATLTRAATLTNCTFTENRARWSGGALYLFPASGTHRVTHCVFRGNFTVNSVGGAVLCEGSARIEGSLFVGNTAISGGGACHSQFGDVTLVNSVLVGNQAGERGGAWSTREGSSLEVVNCTILENRAPEAPFLAVDINSDPGSSQVSVVNCIVSNGGSELWSNDSPVEIAYTCVGQGTVAVGGEEDWLVLGSGNIDGDPCFVDPGYWDSNETPEDPNDDFFVEGNYHLKSQAGRWDPNSENWVADDVTSPCIDVGDPNAPLGDEPIPNGGIINMGAYGGTAEASMSPARGPTEGQWTEPMPLYEVNTDTAEEWSPSLSADGLTLYFGRVHSPTSDLGRIFQATRSDPLSEFTSIEEVRGTLNDSIGHVLCQWVSVDQLRMYYMLQVGAEFSLKVSERSSISGAWPKGAEIWELNQYGHRVAAPYLTADERIIFFSASDIAGTIGGYDIWMATRPDQDTRFGKPVPVEPINTDSNEIHSFITADGLTMYFASDRHGRYQLFRSMRQDLDSPFASPVHMPLFDTPNGDSRAPCLSADGTEFYFQRETDGDRSTRDIWVSCRID